MPKIQNLSSAIPIKNWWMSFIILLSDWIGEVILWPYLASNYGLGIA